MNKKNKIINLIFEDKKKWINVIKSFGVEEQNSQEIFSCMIERIYKNISKGLDITYGNGYNYWYVFKSLRGHFIDYLRTKRQEKKLPIRTNRNGEYYLMYNYDTKDRTNIPVSLHAPKYIDLENLYKKSLCLMQEVQKSNTNLYKIKRHLEIYKQIDDAETTISQYSRSKKLSYWKCYKSYSISKKLLKEKICELVIN